MSYILFIASKTPLFESASQDMLEASMSAANAELSVKIVFVQSGCFQLTTSSSEGIGRKDLNKQLALLSLYEIEDIYYHAPPESVRDVLSNSESALEIGNDEDFKALIDGATQVLVF